MSWGAQEDEARERAQDRLDDMRDGEPEHAEDAA